VPKSSVFEVEIGILGGGGGGKKKKKKKKKKNIHNQKKHIKKKLEKIFPQVDIFFLLI